MLIDCPGAARTLTQADMATGNIIMEEVTGRLNSFQRTMLQWNGLHPYNAVHVMRVAGELDLARLQSVVGAVLESRGLTGFMIDRSRTSFSYQGGAAQGRIKLLNSRTDELHQLIEEIEAQLNQPFDPGARSEPFRFVVAPDGNDAFRLVLVYFHPIADAESIVWLMKDIDAGYQNPAAIAAFKPLGRNPPRHDSLLLRRPGLLLRWLLALPALIRSARSSFRPTVRDQADLRNGFRFFTAASGKLPQLLATAKSWGVTLNDLFLAALLLAVAPLAKERRQAPRRRLISVATIVNIRRDVGRGDQNTFGLALGSFRVAHEVPEGLGLEPLARAMQLQTKRAKQGKLFLATPLQLTFARFLFSRLTPDRQKKFYPKNQPLWAGITNLNLNALWTNADGGAPPDYFRAVSTGPATPLVFSITTAGDRLNVGISFRSAVFLNSEVAHVQDALQSLLTNACRME